MNNALYTRYLENLLEGISSCARIYAEIAAIENRDKQWGAIGRLSNSTYDVYEGLFAAGMLRRGYPVVVLSESIRHEVPDFLLDDEFSELLTERKAFDEPRDASVPIAVLQHVLGAIPSELYDACFYFAFNQNEEGVMMVKNTIGRLAGTTHDAWETLQTCPRYTDDTLIEKFEQALMKCHTQLKRDWCRLSTEIHRREQFDAIAAG